VRLGDVADVRDGTEEPRSAASTTATEAVGIDIKKSKGYSTTAVADAIRAKVDEIQQTLPAGVTLRSCATPACAWRTRWRNVQSALLEGAR
jgi:hydrophobic/amphiphilic exporter-1 (mainly G- bacteria), HAE1 family